MAYTFICPAQDVPTLLKEADKFEAALNEKAALAKYQEVLKVQPTNITALVKGTELCCRIGKRQKNEKNKTAYFNLAKTYAETVVKLYPTNSDANMVMAMALGHISMSKNNKEKIHAAKDLKKYVDLALKENPNNYKAWHVLGRWHYEISNLNMLEKAAVKIFYGGLPSASIKESIAAFEKAHAITKTGFVINCFELARAYERDGQDQKAINILKYMLTLPNHTEDDEATKAEGRKMLKELSS